MQTLIRCRYICTEEQFELEERKFDGAYRCLSCQSGAKKRDDPMTVLEPRIGLIGLDYA